MIKTIDIGPKNYMEMSAFGDGRYVIQRIVDEYFSRFNRVPELLFANYHIIDSFVNNSRLIKKQLVSPMYNTVVNYITPEGFVSICSNDLLEKSEAYIAPRDFFRLLARGEFKVLQESMIRFRIAYRFHSKQQDEPLRNTNSDEQHDWDSAELEGMADDTPEEKSEDDQDKIT